ncbi:MAG: DUF1998 domain-containing protein, partial [Propionibacteriaceae bacterium]|jgi:hypothetical protein|nr:DUF1998 domain-containing protein [Propionibacteriaceae bacterium]
LTHSTAEVRQDEAAISDRDDERERSHFELFTIADLDPMNLTRGWAEASCGFSCSYYQWLTLRWINVGRPPHGVSFTAGGRTRPAKLFRVCEGCGKLDKDIGVNNPQEHRAWCAYRNQYEEHARPIALTHTLRTQGLVLRLPQSITFADDFSMPSLSAAIQLGLRELIGGAPDHLAIVSVKAPAPDGDGTSDALLLHDLVPGGTGYLTDWVIPERLHSLLESAWRIVHDCSCQLEGRLACHRCLLPFAAPSQVSFVSRATAERHLAAMLRVDPDHPTPDITRWALTDDMNVDSVGNTESVLEHHFRHTLLARLRTMGAAIQETPGTFGNTASITLPGSSRRWTLRPQVYIDRTRPDFVLESSDTNVPWVLIYTDGWLYHASPAHNRLADDATKRAGLRDQGYVVLSVTSADVDQAEAAHPIQPILNADLVGQAMQQPLLQASPKAYRLLGLNPIDWLAEWITTPDRENLQKAARAVPLAFVAGSPPVPIGPNEPRELAAARVLRGATGPTIVDSNRQVIVWQQGRLAASIEFLGDRIAIGLVLDDAPDSLGAVNADAWREWLKLSNAMALRDWPTAVTTCSLVESGAIQEMFVKAAPASPAIGLSPEWAGLESSSASEQELALLRRLDKAGVKMQPVLGEEGPQGIPLDLSWSTAKVAVCVDELPQDDRNDLVQDGWLVLDADSETLIADLARAGVN